MQFFTGGNLELKKNSADVDNKEKKNVFEKRRWMKSIWGAFSLPFASGGSGGKGRVVRPARCGGGTHRVPRFAWTTTPSTNNKKNAYKTCIDKIRKNKKILRREKGK